MPLITVNEYVKIINNETGWRLDYIWHFFYYFLFVISFFFWHKNDLKVFKLLVILILSVSLAIANECMQIYVPSRSFNPNDLLANVLGSLFGFTIGYFFIIRKGS
jgi:VanZ family protein